MNKERLPISDADVVPLNDIAPNVSGLRILFVNIFGITHLDGTWTLVDAGIPLSAGRIKKWAESRFGKKPNAIVLTHGHFDHVGSVNDLADGWNVSVFAHPLEMPYLNGAKQYPPPDPAAGGGIMSIMSLIYPKGPIDISDRIRSFTSDGSIACMPEWQWIHTPGHTVGHVSLFREADRTLLVGDAFCTVQSESMLAIAQQRPELHGPPAYYTPDWDAARESVRKLAALKPQTLAPGHGQPVAGNDVSAMLNRLSDRFDEIALPEDQKEHRAA